jgi:phosphoribosyl 1,2-cyclic phosphodiesterase
MQVYFWGTRGSLPVSITAGAIEAKIVKAIRASRARPLDTDAAIEDFVRNELPFSVRASYGGNTSCVELRGADEYVLCDAGTGLRDFGSAYMKAKAGEQQNLPTVFHLLMSHPHWDHIQGFPFFTPAYLPGHRIHIYGGHADLDSIFVRQQSDPCFPVPLPAMRADIRFHTLEPGGEYDISGMKVTCIRQNHPGDSYGYRFQKDGRIVVYSTDSEHKSVDREERDRFLVFFSDADLLIFDAQYSFLDAVGTKENWGHSSNLLAVEMAVAAGVRRLCLFHNEHTLDDDALDRFLEDTRAYLKILDGSSRLKIDLAYDGLDIKL